MQFLAETGTSAGPHLALSVDSEATAKVAVLFRKSIFNSFDHVWVRFGSVLLPSFSQSFPLQV